MQFSTEETNTEVGHYKCLETSENYTVLKITIWTKIKPLNGPVKKSKASQKFVTNCCKDLNPLDKGLNQFIIVESGKVISKN